MNTHNASALAARFGVTAGTVIRLARVVGAGRQVHANKAWQFTEHDADKIFKQLEVYGRQDRTIARRETRVDMAYSSASVLLPDGPMVCPMCQRPMPSRRYYWRTHYRECRHF